MNLFNSQSAFVFVGIAVMIFGLVAAYVLNQTADANQPAADTPATATPDGSVTPEATAQPTKEAQQWDAPEQVTDPATTDYRATIATSKGDIVIDLFEEVAPNTVNNFVFLAQQGYYDNITFHRVVPGFVVQAGDPTGSGTGGPGYLVEEEPNDLTNDRGVLSMAKTSGATEFGSQWFINLADNAQLNDPDSQAGRFFPFAEVTEGMDIVDQIAQGDTIESITIQEVPKDGAASTAGTSPTAGATETATEAEG
jgi:peptidyl-prolyl cis-trans isomerase B (cyclophilin B)